MTHLSRARAVLEKMTPGPWRWDTPEDCDPAIVQDDDDLETVVDAVDGLQIKLENAKGIALLGSIHRQLFDVVEAAKAVTPYDFDNDHESKCGCAMCALSVVIKALETRLAEVLNDK